MWRWRKSALEELYRRHSNFSLLVITNSPRLPAHLSPGFVFEAPVEQFERSLSLRPGVSLLVKCTLKAAACPLTKSASTTSATSLHRRKLAMADLNAARTSDGTDEKGATSRVPSEHAASPNLWRPDANKSTEERAAIVR